MILPSHQEWHWMTDKCYLCPYTLVVVLRLSLPARHHWAIKGRLLVVNNSWMKTQIFESVINFESWCDTASSFWRFSFYSQVILRRSQTLAPGKLAKSMSKTRQGKQWVHVAVHHKNVHYGKVFALSVFTRTHKQSVNPERRGSVSI